MSESFRIPQRPESLHWADFPAVDRRRINGTLGPARNATLLALIGAPRGTYNNECQDATNPDIQSLIDSADLGPFRAMGLRPALVVLRNIMAELVGASDDPLSRIGLNRMLCCRLVRGSKTVISSHAWGVALDLTLDGSCPDCDPESVPRLLFGISRVFIKHGFFWGAAFAKPEYGHFEASDQLVRRWAKGGQFGCDAAKWLPRGLTFADRGPEVEDLQADLNAQLSIEIEVDGLYGKDTRAAVFEFQRCNGLPPDGVAGQATLRALAIASL